MIQNICRKYRFFWPDLAFLGVLALLMLTSLLLALFPALAGPWASRGEVQPFFSLAARIAATSPFAPPQFLPQLSLSVSDTIISVLRSTLEWLGRQGSLLVYTDPAATYANPSVTELWGIVLAIADATIGIFIALAGYHIMLGGFSARYTEALEALPRLVSAFIGANVSLLFARFWIDLNNLLCAIMLTQTANHPLSAFSIFITVIGLNIFILPFLAFFTLLLLILGIQMVVRLALILFLTVCLPVLFVLLANRHTQRIGQAGISSYIAAVMTQVLQLTCLTIGVKVLLSFLLAHLAPATALAPLATLLVGIGLLWLTLRIPGMLRQWSLAPIAEGGQAALSLIVASFARRLFF
jgi:hypothetical protein